MPNHPSHYNSFLTYIFSFISSSQHWVALKFTIICPLYPIQSQWLSSLPSILHWGAISIYSTIYNHSLWAYRRRFGARYTCVCVNITNRSHFYSLSLLLATAATWRWLTLIHTHSTPKRKWMDLSGNDDEDDMIWYDIWCWPSCFCDTYVD